VSGKYWSSVFVLLLGVEVRFDRLVVVARLQVALAPHVHQRLPALLRHFDPVEDAAEFGDGLLQFVTLAVVTLAPIAVQQVLDDFSVSVDLFLRVAVLVEDSPELGLVEFYAHGRDERPELQLFLDGVRFLRALLRPDLLNAVGEQAGLLEQPGVRLLGAQKRGRELGVGLQQRPVVAGYKVADRLAFLLRRLLGNTRPDPVADEGVDVDVASASDGRGLKGKFEHRKGSTYQVTSESVEALCRRCAAGLEDAQLDATAAPRPLHFDQRGAHRDQFGQVRGGEIFPPGVLEPFLELLEGHSGGPR